MGALLETKEDRGQAEETKALSFTPVDKTTKGLKTNTAYIKEYTRMLQ